MIAPAPTRVSILWKSSYMDTTEYQVLGDGAPYRVEVLSRASDYHRSIYNGDDAEWQRDIVAAIDLLRRTSDPTRPVPPHVVEEFNRWRANQHAAFLARLRGDPRRYGPVDDADHPPPRSVRGGQYVLGEGWRVTTP